MANTDSFIDEVAEEVRRDRLFRVFRRYGWIAVVAVVAIVGGAAVVEWQKAQRRAAAQAFGDAILTALDAPDAAARRTALEAIAPPAGEGGALLALLLSDATLATGVDGDRTLGLAALERLAEDATLDPMWRDLAALRHVVAAGDSLPVAERRAALTPLAAPGRPYRPLAQEQLALLDLGEGDRASALATFRALGDDQQATEALRRRAAQMIVILGGAGEAQQDQG